MTVARDYIFGAHIVYREYHQQVQNSVTVVENYTVGQKNVHILVLL